MRYPLKYIKPEDVCVEVGVWKGEFAKHILQKNPSMLYLIDPWQAIRDVPGRCYDIKQGEMDVIFDNVEGKLGKKHNVSIIRDFSSPASKNFQDNSLDWVYLDANHSFEFVYEDLNLWYDKVKEGGFLCGDDYRENKKLKWGVIEAVNSFAEHKNIKNNLIIKGNQFIFQKK